MTTQTFNRGISDDFVEVLNSEYDKGGWWRNLVDDPNTFVAIRGKSGRQPEYLNLYYRGCSLLKLENGTRKGLDGKTDYKYLKKLPEASDYIGGVVQKGEVKSLDLIEHLFDAEGNFDRLKEAVRFHAERAKERDGVHDIVIQNPLALDIEIAMSGLGLQFDLAFLHEDEGRVRLRFYEAKRFSNNDLRASGADVPKVLEQIDRYSASLHQHAPVVTQSYRTVCKNLLSIKGLDKRHPERHSLLQRIVSGSVPLHIDIHPYLIIFGFDTEQKVRSKWREHERKLEGSLTRDRLQMEGDPKALVLRH